MNKSIAIHKLAAQLGLTSRTLRHWESEGLFTSGRDQDSGWRVYDEDAVLRIRLTALLRKHDVPISDIKTVTDENSFEKLQAVVLSRLSDLKAQKLKNAFKENQLLRFSEFLLGQAGSMITDDHLSRLSAFAKVIMNSDDKKEDYHMPDYKENGNSLKFVTLPSMRAVYHVAVGVSPEDFAMDPVMEWLNSEHLNGTARLFGGDMPPLPKGDGKPYGYGFCASIPENTPISDPLKEIRLPGGVYAMLESTDDIGASWKALMKLLSENENYMSDRSRLCLEEHLPNDANGFHIMLLEPVKAKK
jgi:DNA-binding transcriptional MerR regulator